MTHKASDFLPLTPEILRQAHKDWLGGGLCEAVGLAAVSALPPEADFSEADLVWERVGNALRRLYEASEGPWETDDWGFLKRFGHPYRGSAERRACLLRMADWLEARGRCAMKRRLTIEVEVGDAADSECGECPFRALDWEGGVPSGRYLCTCPAWDPADVTGGRHRECIEAGEDHEGASRLSVALDLLRRIAKYAKEDGARTPGSTRLDRALVEARDLLEREATNGS